MSRRLSLIVLSMTLFVSPAHAGFVSDFWQKAKGLFGVGATSNSGHGSSSENPVDHVQQEFKSAATKGLHPTESKLLQPWILDANQRLEGHMLSDKQLAFLSYEVVQSLPNQETVQLKPEFLKEGILLKVLVTEKALENPLDLVPKLHLAAALVNFQKEQRALPLVELTPFQQKMTRAQGGVTESLFLFETLVNANEGFRPAQERLLQLEVTLLKGYKVSPWLKNRLSSLISSSNVDTAIEDLFKNRIANLETVLLPDLAQKAAQDLRSADRKIEQWRKETRALEHFENSEEKLNDLILKNDRAGVARLLEAYLPWAAMSPSEARAWRTWLEAIVTPDSRRQVIAFRGLDFKTDFVQRGPPTASGERAYGFMSTLLTQNQGSYTRRLRSLSTKRIQNGDAFSKHHPAKLVSVSMLEQMKAHSQDPRGSAFMSFTYSGRIAFNFTNRENGGFLAVKMDSRRLMPNLASLYSAEVELLAPLIVFPDEVLFYEEGTKEKALNSTRVIEQIKAIEAEQSLRFVDRGTAKGGDYFLEGLEFIKRLTTPAVGTCAKVWQ